MPSERGCRILCTVTRSGVIEVTKYMSLMECLGWEVIGVTVSPSWKIVEGAVLMHVDC